MKKFKVLNTRINQSSNQFAGGLVRAQIIDVMEDVDGLEVGQSATFGIHVVTRIA